MGKIAGILGVLLVAGIVLYRLFFWGAEVFEYVETGQRNEQAGLSNSVVDPLNEAADTIYTVHDLIRRASDPTTEKHRGTVLLLEFAENVVSESIAEARQSIQTVDIVEDDNARALVGAANNLLNVYEGFIPVHKALTGRILASGNYPPELTQEVDAVLFDLESTMNGSIDAFSASQDMFLK